jgi:hypothetical protein
VGDALAAALTEVGEEGVQEHHHGRHQQHTGTDGQHGRRVIVHLEHHGRVPVSVGDTPTGARQPFTILGERVPRRPGTSLGGELGASRREDDAEGEREAQRMEASDRSQPVRGRL